MTAKKLVIIFYCCIAMMAIFPYSTQSDCVETYELDNLSPELPVLLSDLSAENETMESSISPIEDSSEDPNIIFPTSPYAAGSVEEAAWLYARFLRSEIPGYHEDGSAQWLGDFYFRCVDDESLDTYSVRDLTGDGIPELFLGRSAEIWTIENSRVVNLISYSHSYWTLLPIGAIYYERPGNSHSQTYIRYEGITEKSKQYPDISLAYQESYNDFETDMFWINGVEVSKEKWDETTSVYFAIKNAAPEEDEIALVFSEWIKSLEDFELPPKTEIDATVVEGDGSFSIIATDFGNHANPDRAYTLTLYDRKGLPVQTVGYGQYHPNIHYVSDSILQISYHAGSGFMYYWFYDTKGDTLSPMINDFPIVQDRTLVSFSYDRSFDKMVLKVSDMFDPDLYTEIFDLKIPPSDPVEDALINATIEGRQLKVSYIGGEDEKRIQVEYELGKNLPKWQTDYYEYIGNSRLVSITLIDFNHDGLPELCTISHSNLFRIADVFFRTEEGITTYPLGVTTLYKLTDKHNSENRWLMLSASDTVYNYHTVYSIRDFNDLSKPNSYEKLFIGFSWDGHRNVSITVAVDEVQIILSEEEQDVLLNLYNSTEALTLDSSYEQAFWAEMEEKYEIERFNLEEIMIWYLYSKHGDGYRLMFTPFIAKLNSFGALN